MDAKEDPKLEAVARLQASCPEGWELVRVEGRPDGTLLVTYQERKP